MLRRWRRFEVHFRWCPNSVSMTERLYYADSYLKEFDAEVVGTRTRGSHFGVVLDRTAFYPTSGGQPYDLGTLNGVSVIDVEDEGEDIVHVLSAPVAGAVRGVVDWSRRFDHMQQHSGQHVLSQAFLQVTGAPTRAVHFGVEGATLDLELADLTAQAGEQVEDLANSVVVEDRAVRVYEVDEPALMELGLRRPPHRGGRIRVVDIEGFDRSACGGTHVRRTGEIGPIQIRRWERAKGGIRTEFLCGWRAVRDYRRKTALLREMGKQLSVGEREMGDAVRRLTDEVAASQRAIAALRGQALTAEAQARVRAAGRGQVIAEIVAGRSAAEIADLAGRTVGAGAAVVLLGTPEGKVVFARSPEASADMHALLRRVSAVVGGGGGGRPEFAQGAVPPSRVVEAIERATADIAQEIPPVPRDAAEHDA